MYYVTPHSPNPDCPSGEPCLTINEYAQGSHFDGDDNITLLFLNGEHNLTVQDFKITNKSSLEMAPQHIQDEVVIFISNKMYIRIQNIFTVKLMEMKFTKIFEWSHLRECLVLTDLDLLLLTKISIESCSLTVQGGMNADTAEVAASKKSLVDLDLNQSYHSSPVAVRNSTLRSNDNIKDQAYVSYTTTNALRLEKCSMINSLLSVTPTATSYKLSILESNFTTRIAHSYLLKTGIEISLDTNVVLHLLIKKCNIVGNYYGILIWLERESYSVYLNVDQCSIVNNSVCNSTASGGIVVFASSIGIINANISSSILLGNVHTQIWFSSWGTIATTVVNTTVRGSRGCNHQPGIGANFEVGTYNVTSYSSLNFIQNQIEDNDIGISIGGILGMYGRYKATVVGTNIKQNQHGLVVDPNYIPMLDTCSLIDKTIIVKDTCFEANNGVSLGVLRLQPKNYSLTFTTLRNVTFFNNTNLLSNAGVVQADANIHLSVEDSCVFKANIGTSIQALATTVTLSGRVIFVDNIALQGGAISMSYSMMRLQSVEHRNVSIHFENNRAEIGGGIYIGPSIYIDTSTGSSCFYELEGLSYDDLKNLIIKLNIVFKNNTATNGGTDIYGATPNTFCEINFLSSRKKHCSQSIKDYIFRISSNISAVSSDPKRVCLCDSFSKLMCADFSHIFYNTTRYPGEVFSLSLAVVGLGFGTVTGLVYANLLPTQTTNHTSSLGSNQHIRQVEYKSCTQLVFSVNSNNENKMETIVLTVNNTVITESDNSSLISNAIKRYLFSGVVPFTLLVVPVYIHVTLLDCPPGFVLTKTGRCDCITALKEIGINNCSIFETIPYVTHSENQWIQLTSNSDSILTSKYCPFNYCKREAVNVNLYNPDEQCALNHSDTLCGACLSNLSLAIGSSRCLECPDNNHIALLIAFAAAGVLLVLFIKILDLTVTKGTINGLILYANIIWANQSVLFPPQEQTSPLLQFLKVFIAWVNLDFGIETCFIQGLDGYWKTWLQFVFPAYIWLIAGLIILVSHYSTRVTKVIGNNSVSVLSTLFLLAYAKLLCTTLVILDFTILEKYPNNQRIIKWSFDGRLPYFGLKHSFLFVFAIVVLLVLWLPYTFTLLFIQPLRRYSHHRSLRWVNRLTPLFDSYVGLLKSTYHYWIGLGLLARLVILLTSALTLSSAPFISVAVLVVTVSVLMSLVLSVYKQWQLGVLEGCFLVNMVLFGSGAFIIELQEGDKNPLACTSLMITFILFLAIVVYHVYKRFRLLKKQRKNPEGNFEAINDENPTSPHASPQNQPTVTHVSITHELREPLLDYISH